jgi:anti-sigma regulatory factor (Ser/Thr protein kinase)
MIEVDVGPGPVPFARHVTLRATEGDPLEAKRVRRQVMALLADQPRELLCDLTELNRATPEMLEALRTLARHQAEWPGTPVGVACGDPRVHRQLLRDARGGRLVVGATVPVVEAMLAPLPPAEHATTTLEPGLTAPRSARAFVARACLRWQARSIIGHACLVTSELVTNVVLHADTTAKLTISRCPGRLRIAVQDGDETRPATSWAASPETTLTGSGRGLLLVSSVCRAWGVHPTDDGGKIVWAVLDDTSAAPDPARRPPRASRRR